MAVVAVVVGVQGQTSWARTRSVLRTRYAPAIFDKDLTPPPLPRADQLPPRWPPVGYAAAGAAYGRQDAAWMAAQLKHLERRVAVHTWVLLAILVGCLLLGCVVAVLLLASLSATAGGVPPLR